MKRGDAPEELMKSIAAMRKQLSQFRIIGGEGVTVHGSMQHGYAVSVEGGGTGGGGGASGGNGGDATGACCIDGACSIQTEADCTGAGGTYQGDDTTCSPDPCAAPTGACCHTDENGCEMLTQADCEGGGGVYQGDATPCVPNPCCCDYYNDGSCVYTPTSISIEGTITGTVNSAEEGACAGAPVSFSVTIPLASQTFTEEEVCTTIKTGGLCTALPLESSGSMDYSCPDDCAEHVDYSVAVRTRMCFADPFHGSGTGWTLLVDVDSTGSPCGSIQGFGGDEQMVATDLGDNPSGTYHFDQDDSNTPSVHYDITVIISGP